MNIRIVGYAGSGKTTLSKKIEATYRLTSVSLDDYLKIKNKEHRFHALYSRLKQLDDWVVEGVQVGQWTNYSFKEADLIVVLDYPFLLCQFRVAKRAITQIFSSKKAWKQKGKIIKRMFKLFKWNWRFRQRFPKIKSSLNDFPVKMMILETPKNEYQLERTIKKHIRKRK